MPYTQFEFDTLQDAVPEIVDLLVSNLNSALVGEKTASFVISGGNSPREIYRCLGKIDLPWERVLLIPSDERWVDIGDSNSNEGMVRSTLMAPKCPGEKAQLISLRGSEDDLELTVESANSSLSKISRPYDVSLLGMGEDGHIASLFPDEFKYDNSNHVVATRSPKPPTLRLSMTSDEILSCRHIILIASGSRKIGILDKISASGADSDSVPVSMLFGSRAPQMTIFSCRAPT